MTLLKIKAAILEAQKFAEKAQRMLEYSSGPTFFDTNDSLYNASLDLTRALAEMRKP